MIALYRSLPEFLSLKYRSILNHDRACAQLGVTIYQIVRYLARSSPRPERTQPEPVLEHLEAPGYKPHTNLYHFLVQLREKSRLSETITLGWIEPHSRIVRELPREAQGVNKGQCEWQTRTRNHVPLSVALSRSQTWG